MDDDSPRPWTGLCNVLDLNFVYFVCFLFVFISGLFLMVKKQPRKYTKRNPPNTRKNPPLFTRESSTDGRGLFRERTLAFKMIHDLLSGLFADERR